MTGPSGEQDPRFLSTARRCAESRRVMLNAWTEESLGRAFALDLMAIDVRSLRPEHLDYADDVRRANAAALSAAVPYIADADLVDLLDVAAPTMPDQPLAETDLLAPHGWVWFEEPLPDRTGITPEVPFRALSWSLLDPTDPMLTARLDGAVPPLPAVVIHAYCEAVEYQRAHVAMAGGDGGQVALAPGRPALVPAASSVWTVTSLIGTAFGRAVEDSTSASNGTGAQEERYNPGFYQRVAAAFWTLAKQPLTQTEEHAYGNRADRRRSARAGVTRSSEPVRVIRLSRRSGGSTGSGTGRSVSVRFPVSGHWRNQWLPSTKSHRQQWISPYMKGPDDAPVLGGERVFLVEGSQRSVDGDSEE